MVAPYPINPADPTYPRDSDPAQYSAAEIRALKALVAGYQFPGAAGTNLFRRNLITNGDFYFDQRYEGAATVLSQAIPRYVADRFVATCATGATATSQRVTGTLTAGSLYYGQVNTTVVAAPAIADVVAIETAIEGLDTGFLQWGTATAAPISLSFIASSPVVGLHAVALRNNAANRSCIATYTILLANTPQAITINNIPGDIAGAWTTDITKGIDILWDLGSGSNYETVTTGAWQAGNFLRTAGCVKASGIIGIFKITNIQLEQAAAASVFEQVPYWDKFFRCLRFYEKCFDAGVAPASGLGAANQSVIQFNQATNSAAGGAISTTIQFKTPKRMSTSAGAIARTYNPTLVGVGNDANMYDQTAAASCSSTSLQAGTLIGYISATPVAVSNLGHTLSVAWTINTDYWLAGSNP